MYYGTVNATVGSVGATFTEAGRQVLLLTTDPLHPIRAECATVRLECSSTSEVEITGIWLNYYHHAREGQTFDSSTQDYGTELMKRARECIIEMENATPVTIDLLTDHPGELMTVRQTKTIPPSPGRRMVHIVWDNDLVGYLHRHFLYGEDLNVYSIRALIQPIGTFLLGLRGEFWLSDPIDNGTERIKLWKEIEVDYAAAAPGTLTLETDQPGGALAIRATFTLPSTLASTSTINEERTIKLRLLPTVKGRLLRIRVVPQGDMRIEAIRTYTKRFGETGTAAWEWVDLPVTPTQDAVWKTVERPPDQLA